MYTFITQAKNEFPTPFPRYHITHTKVAHILTTSLQTLDFINSAPGMKLGYIEKCMTTSYKQLQHGCTEKSLLSHNFYLRNQDNPLCIPIKKWNPPIELDKNHAKEAASDMVKPTTELGRLLPHEKE